MGVSVLSGQAVGSPAVKVYFLTGVLTCKADLEIDLAKLRIASKIQYTEKEVAAWMKLFCKGDLMDPAFRERIIDTFINSVFVYDDKIVIFYNIRGGKQVSYIEMKEAEPADFLFDEDFTESQPGSTFKVCARLLRF